jgi:transposase
MVRKFWEKIHLVGLSDKMHVMKQVMEVKCHQSCHLNKQCNSVWLLLCKMSYKINLRLSIYNLVGRMPKRDIVDIYREQNISKSTIYRTIKECEEGIPCVNLPKSGRPRVLNQLRQGRLIQAAKHKIGISQRKLARKFNVGKTTVFRTLSSDNIVFRKRRKAPKYTEAQLERIPRCCRTLRRVHFVNKLIVMDDEKYFTLSNSEMKGNDGFYTDNYQNVPDDVRFKNKKKFEDKILVWCAISEAGFISQPYIGVVRGEALNAERYIQRCLSKLRRFLNTHHADDEIMFWPDLATCHYSRITRDWYEANNINFVPKVDNPPNLPQARPIEEFWAILSRKIYNNGWEAQNEEQLRRRISRKIREIDAVVVQRMMQRVRGKLRQIENNGPLSII